MGKTSAEAVKPYVAVVVVQCTIAGMILMSKAAMSAGMKPSIFVTYRQTFATAVLLPFGLFFFFFFKSNNESLPLTWLGLFKIFLVASSGLTLGLNLLLAGLEYTSATFGTAAFCIVPCYVFVMAVCFRIESLEITKRHGMAKVLGTLIGLSGALAFTFIKGPLLFNNSNHQNPNHNNSEHGKTHTKEEWIKGSFLVIVSNLFYALWLTMQAPLLKQFPGKLRLAFLQSVFSSITAAIYGAAVERNLSSWKLGWNIQLLSVTYCGVIMMGISYWSQAWIIEKKGPVFSAIFGPLSLILAAILSAIFLDESLYWGSILGGGLLVIGLYSFLWGKNKEAQKEGPNEELNCSAEDPNNNCNVV